MQISKWVIAFVAVYGGLGGVLFDAILPATARQHLWNPAWPPHAKFHNGQTMLMGMVNAVTTLLLLFVLKPLTLPMVLIAAWVAATYFACMLIAPVFPGTAWSDPEFEASNPRPFGIPVQMFLSLLALGAVVIAVMFAVMTMSSDCRSQDGFVVLKSILSVACGSDWWAHCALLTLRPARHAHTQMSVSWPYAASGQRDRRGSGRLSA